jgi:ATP-binding cassette, subfamily B, bacterial PglK
MIKALKSHIRKIRKIFTKEQRKKTVNIVFLLIIAALLEMFSIGLIVPLIGILISGSLKDSLFFDTSYSFIENFSSEELIVYGMSFMAIVYIIKAIYLVVIAFYQSDYIYDIQQSISSRLVEMYIKASYTFHLQNNPSKLINTVINEVNLFSINVTVPLNIILSEFFVVIGLLFLLFFYEPLGALIVFTFLIITSVSFYAFMRKKIASWGELRQVYDERRLKSIQEILYGSKEIRILGREEWFTGIFFKNNLGSARIQSIQRSFLQLPRLVIEVLAIISLLLLIFVMVLKGVNADQMIMIVGLFAAISFRIAPSVNKVLVSFQEMRYASSIVDKIYSELVARDESKTLIKRPAKQNIEKISFSKSLNFNGVKYRYPSSDKPTLNNLNLSINSGEFIGVIGESGSGKTTFLNLILGLIEPIKGTIEVDGLNVHSNVKGWQSNIGYVPQSVYLIDDSIRNNIAFGISPDKIDNNLLQEVIKMSRLESLVSKSDNGVDFVVGDRGNNLSGGQAQRVGIARALYHQPTVLVLDEATSSLDSSTEKLIIDTVKNLKGKLTIVLVTHKMSAISSCDRVFEITNESILEVER